MTTLNEAGREAIERLIEDSNHSNNNSSSEKQELLLSRDVKFALLCGSSFTNSKNVTSRHRAAEYLVKELELGGLGYNDGEIEGVIFDLVKSPVSHPH